jgi:hypothetical protein
MISDPKPPLAGEPAGLEARAAAVAERGNSDSVRPIPVAAAPSRLRVWLRRFGVLLFVFLCATIGVMLMILPWRPEWTDNPLLFSYPTVRELLATGFVRGLVSGLGLLNVWIGFWEAVRYQEE